MCSAKPPRFRRSHLDLQAHLRFAAARDQRGARKGEDCENWRGLLPRHLPGGTAAADMRGWQAQFVCFGDGNGNFLAARVIVPIDIADPTECLNTDLQDIDDRYCERLSNRS